MTSKPNSLWGGILKEVGLKERLSFSVEKYSGLMMTCCCRGFSTVMSLLVDSLTMLYSS